MTIPNAILLSLLMVAPGIGLAAQPTAYVINTSSQTLSKIDLTGSVVSNDILPLGSDIYSFPNQLVIRDTLAYVVASGTDEIQIIDLNAERTVGWIRFPDYSNPYWMAFLDDQFLYVTLMTDNSLAKVDITSQQVVRTTPIGLSPEGIFICRGKAYVAITAYDFGTWNWGQGKVVVYDTESDSVTGEMPVGTNPQFMDVDRRGRLHVSCTGNYADVAGAVYVIDTETDQLLDSIAIGGQPGQIAVGADDRVYLAAGGWTADGEVFQYDALTGIVFHGGANPLLVDSGATGAVAYQDSTVFISTFGDRLNRLTAAGQKVNTYHVGDGPIHVAFNYLPGDANGDWSVDIGDAVRLINYVFRGGAAPADPAWRANANADGAVDVGDAVYLINYVFHFGPRPRVSPTWIR